MGRVTKSMGVMSVHPYGDFIILNNGERCYSTHEAQKAWEDRQEFDKLEDSNKLEENTMSKVTKNKLTNQDVIDTLTSKIDCHNVKGNSFIVAALREMLPLLHQLDTEKETTPSAAIDNLKVLDALVTSRLEGYKTEQVNYAIAEAGAKAAKLTAELEAKYADKQRVLDKAIYDNTLKHTELDKEFEEYRKEFNEQVEELKKSLAKADKFNENSDKEAVELFIDSCINKTGFYDQVPLRIKIDGEWRYKPAEVGLAELGKLMRKVALKHDFI